MRQGEKELGRSGHGENKTEKKAEGNLASTTFNLFQKDSNGVRDPTLGRVQRGGGKKSRTQVCSTGVSDCTRARGQSEIETRFKKRVGRPIFQREGGQSTLNKLLE